MITEIIKTKDELLITPKAPQPEMKDHVFYGHGKLLLSGEYAVLEGAQSLAIPTRFGQSLKVNYKTSYNPRLNWKSYDVHGNLWYEDEFEFWRFNSLRLEEGQEASETSILLQNLLRQARVQNAHFLREEVDVNVETRIGFPLEWGLGSSSSLIYNIAQWAYISPFELAAETFGGSGYDIACAQSEGPILYTRNSIGPKWSPTDFWPDFADNLYFVYLGSKANSRDAISQVECKRPFHPTFIKDITACTQQMSTATELSQFEKAMNEHEEIVSQALELPKVKDLRFKDFWGSVKSLGAWGGDFALVSSSRSLEETMKYFQSKGLDIVIGFKDMALPPSGVENENVTKH